MAAILLTLLATTAAATESDVGKEQRWAEQVIDGLLDGDEAWLDDGKGHEFLAVLTEGDSDSKRAVIVVHGIGVHPNWPDVIYPLREALLEAEVTSLSIQMPILANEAEASDYAPLMAETPDRFEAAIRYLGEAGYDQVAILAHSLGSTMAAYYLSRHQNEAVIGFAAIGMSRGNGVGSDIDNPATLGQIGVDILDLYGSEDLESVLASAADRADAARSRGSADYRQVEVDGANHFFQGHEDELKQQVLDWLAQRWR